VKFQETCLFNLMSLRILCNPSSVVSEVRTNQRSGCP